MAEAQLPSTNKNNAAGTGGQPPQQQVTAAPQFVRQTMSTAPTPYQFGGLAGGPMGGFSGGMGPGPQMSAGAPQMSAGGFAPPVQAMGTAGLVQGYPVGQPQMGAPAPIPGFGGIPGPQMAGAFGQTQPMGAGYEQGIPGFEPWWEDPTAPSEPLQPLPFQSDADVGGGYAERGRALELQGGEVTGYNVAEGPGGADTYADESGNLWIVDPETGYDVPGKYDSQGNVVQAEFEPGELLGADDYTYQSVMTDRGIIDPSQRFELSPGSLLDTSDIEASYEKQEQARQAQMGAAARAFQEWASRSGTMMSPTAMSQYAGQLESQFAEGNQALIDWREGEISARTAESEQAMHTEVDMYAVDVRKDTDDYLEYLKNQMGGERGVSPAFRQYMEGHIDKWIDMGLSRNEIDGARRSLEQMFVEEYGVDPFEDVTNEEWIQMNELAGGYVPPYIEGDLNKDGKLDQYEKKVLEGKGIYG